MAEKKSSSGVEYEHPFSREEVKAVRKEIRHLGRILGPYITPEDGLLRALSGSYPKYGDQDPLINELVDILGQLENAIKKSAYVCSTCAALIPKGAIKCADCGEAK